MVTLTGSDMQEMGVEPEAFWINSMGEYGHHWPAGSMTDETIGGTINLKEAAEAAGYRWEPPYDVPADVVQRAERHALHAELVMPGEHVLYRLWDHFRPLGSDLWRFYAHVVYTEGRYGKVGTSVSLSIEYIVTEEQQKALTDLAAKYGGEIEEMHEDWDDKSKTQIAVTFEVLGKSFGEIAALQVRWLDEARDFNSHLVSVI